MFSRVRKSFSLRLSVYIITITAIIFIATTFLIYHYSRGVVHNEASLKAEVLLKYINERIDNTLHSVEVVIDNTESAILNNLANPDEMFQITANVMKNNAIISGCAIAFEPDFYKSKGRYFAPFTYKKGTTLKTAQIGAENYNYFEMDWYAGAKQSGKKYWTDPYIEDGLGNMMISTYSKPIFDKQGKFIGVVTADISLSWLTSVVSEVKPYPSSYTFILGPGGRYIVHPNARKVYDETIFSVAREMKDSTVAEIGKRMIRGESGRMTLVLNQVPSYVFFSPISRTGWSVGIVSPQKEVYATVSHLSMIIFVIFLVGLVVMFLTCMPVIRNMTAPLINFASSARIIAKGDFTTALPQIKSDDEMAELGRAFGHMQSSLIHYIDELRTTTVSKERIESELRIASEIQRGMIPKIFPPFPERNDIELYAMLSPAKEVGGDLYDFFIQNECLYFVIGDVSGKGIPASLLMAVTRSIFRSVATHQDKADRLVTSINKAITETNESNMFVTMFVGILNLKNGELEYCNAGHNPPIIIDSVGNCKFLEMLPNLAVGLFDSFVYQSERIRVENGHTLFLYTDGLTEAENATYELYGEERLFRILSSDKITDVRSITEKVNIDIKKHVCDAPQSDDLTILTINYKGWNII